MGTVIRPDGMQSPGFSGPLGTGMRPEQSVSIGAVSHTPPRGPSSRRFPLLRILVAALVILAVVGGLVVLFAPGPPSASRLATTATRAARTPLPSPSPVEPRGKPTPAPTGNPSPSPTPSPDWVPRALPPGWSATGLSMGDALFALRTAMTFADREMSLDWRNAGTRGQHAGTLTAAVFLLTPGGRARFFANDVRVIDNALFDRVERLRVIQAVVGAAPALRQYSQMGRKQFAWVDVSFYLWRSQLDAQSGKRVEGLDLDPATTAPRLHHLVVLLLRVPLQNQGANAPMGGSGWLVSTYELDAAGGVLPAILQPA